MDLLTAALAILCAAAFLVVPGALAGWGLGLQGMTRRAVAPAFSLGLLTLTVWLCAGLGLPWTPAVAVAVLAACLVPFCLGRVLSRWHGVPWPLLPRSSLGWPLRIHFALCGLLAVAPLLVVMGSLTTPIQTWDSIFHMSALALERSLRDPSPFSAFSSLFAGAQHYYPHTFHSLAAILPGSAVVSFNALLVVAVFSWPWQVGVFCYYLLTRRFGATQVSRFATGVAALGAGAGVAFPGLMSTVMNLTPYLFSLSFTPGLLLAIVAWWRLLPSLSEARWRSQVAQANQQRKRLGLPVAVGAQLDEELLGKALSQSLPEQVPDIVPPKDTAGKDTAGDAGRDPRQVETRNGQQTNGQQTKDGAPDVTTWAQRWSHWGQMVRYELFSSELLPWVSLAVMVCALGIVGTHPSSVFNLVLLGLVPVLTFLVWHVRQVRSWRVRLALALALAAVLVAGAFLLGPRLVNMANYPRVGGNPFFYLACGLFDYPISFRAPALFLAGTPVLVLGLVGAWRYRRCTEARFLFAGFMVSLLMTIIAGGPAWWGRILTAPWYMQASRIAPLIYLCLYPLAALGVAWLTCAALARFPSWSGRRWVGAGAACLVVWAVATGGFTLVGRVFLARVAFDPAYIAWGTMLTEGEKQFQHQSVKKLRPTDKILADPFSGAPYYWIIENQPVLFASLNQPATGKAKYLVNHIDQADRDPQVCQVMKELGVTHFYEDTDTTAGGARYKARKRPKVPGAPKFTPPRSLLELVADHPQWDPQASKVFLTDPDNENFSGQRLYRIDYSKCPK